MFKIRNSKKTANNNKNNTKKILFTRKKSQVNLFKSCIFTIGLLTTFTLIGCEKENSSASANEDSQPSVVTETTTKSKAEFPLLCKSNNSLTASYETKQYWIGICDEENQLFFVRQFKSDLSQLIRLPAYWNTENSGFSAHSGDTIYAVNGEGLKVWQGNKSSHDPIVKKSSGKPDIISIITHLKLATVFKTISAGLLLTALYIYGKPYIHRLGSNGRAIAYVVNIVAWPGIVVTCLAIAEIPLGLLASLTGALALGFSFGSQKVVENVATVALNLRDDVYEVDDIIGFAGDDDFYRVDDIKTSTVKLVSLAGNAGRVLNISPSVLAQKEFVNYTQDGHGTLCKWVFPISLKAQIAQPGKGDMTKMEDTLLQAAKEVQTWIIQNTKHPEAIEVFAEEANKEKGRKDIPAGVFLTKVEKFIHHYAIALWIPGIEIHRVASISNELLHRVWHHAVENYDIELATPNTADDTDIVEATQAIAQSLRESLAKVSTSNGSDQNSTLN